MLLPPQRRLPISQHLEWATRYACFTRWLFCFCELPTSLSSCSWTEGGAREMWVEVTCTRDGTLMVYKANHFETAYPPPTEYTFRHCQFSFLRPAVNEIVGVVISSYDSLVCSHVCLANIPHVSVLHRHDVGCPVTDFTLPVCVRAVVQDSQPLLQQPKARGLPPGAPPVTAHSLVVVHPPYTLFVLELTLNPNPLFLTTVTLSECAAETLQDI